MEICCFISFSGHKNKVKSVLNLNKWQLRLQIPKQHQAAIWWLMKELHNIGLDGWMDILKTRPCMGSDVLLMQTVVPEFEHSQMNAAPQRFLCQLLN